MKVYLVPGLGYDHRIFGRLDLGGISTINIEWIEPVKAETLHDYAQRLFAEVKDEEENILIGHSLGAIVSQEIARVKKIDKIIVISSIQSSEEMPFFFRMMNPLRLHKLFTKEFGIRTIKYWGKNHGFPNTEDQELFKSMLTKQSNHYLQWALGALSAWQSPQVPAHTQVVQIHGTDDKNFPIGKIKKVDFLIEGGSHVMVYGQAEKISKILVEEINKMKL